MALIKCPECGKDVSDKAEVCPHCGINLKEIDNLIEQSKAKEAEINQKKGEQESVRLLLVGFVIVIVLIILVGWCSEYSEKRERQIQQNIIDRSNERIEENNKKKKELDKLIDDYERAHR